MHIPAFLAVGLDKVVQLVSFLNNAANTGSTFNDVQGKYIGAIVES